MPEIVALRDQLAPETVLIGNGDILTVDEIEKKYQEFGCEGFMVGRGIFANPWMFNQDRKDAAKSVEERVALYLHHIELFEKQWEGRHNFALLKKFAKTYISNFPEASELRVSLMESKNIGELKEKLVAHQIA